MYQPDFGRGKRGPAGESIRGSGWGSREAAPRALGGPVDYC